MQCVYPRHAFASAHSVAIGVQTARGKIKSRDKAQINSCKCQGTLNLFKWSAKQTNLIMKRPLRSIDSRETDSLAR